MPGFTHNDNSIANGIPARFIGPETGSSGNATMTNHGGTSEGVNESPDSIPAPAAGLEAPIFTGKHRKEEHSSDAVISGETPFDPNEESAVQQIADGGDHIKHHGKDEHHR
jgi:hypothetical protein